MLYQLGDIKFEPIDGPRSFEKVIGVNFVEQPRIEGKPTLQKVSGVLDQIELDFKLHHAFSDIRKAISSFREAAMKAEPLNLINGLGISEGIYVIQQIRIGYEKMDNVGRLFESNIQLSLIEYVSPDEAEAEDMAARKKGFANISVKPIEVTPVPRFQNPKALVMREITATNASAATASSWIKKAAAVPVMAKKYLSQAERSLTTAKESAERAKAGVDSLTSEISNAVALKSGIESVISSIFDIKSTFTEDNLSNLRNLSLMLDINLGILQSTAAQLANKIVTRK